MKKPSGTNLSLHNLTFFTDRDLGKKVPSILRENGLTVERYFDHFEEGVRVADNEWLFYAIQKGWIALSHDDNIRRDMEAVRTIMENSGRLFILRGALTAGDLASVFLEALHSVVHHLEALQEQAFIANVRRSTHFGGKLRSAAHLMLTAKEWRLGKLPREEV